MCFKKFTLLSSNRYDGLDKTKVEGRERNYEVVAIVHVQGQDIQ